MHDDVDVLDRAWADIRSRRELSGEAKLAWHFLWKRARRRPGEVWFAYLELAIDQGRTERPPRDWVKHLRRKRFIELLEEGDGRARVYVKNPQDVLRPGERIGVDDAQRKLFGVAGEPGPEAPLPTVDAAQDPPVDAARLCIGEEENLSPHRALAPLEPLEALVPMARARAPVDPAHDPPREPRALGALVAGRAAAIAATLPGDVERAARREEIIAYVLRRVGDKDLRVAPVKRVADAIVDGERGFSQRHLDDVLRDLEKHSAERTLRRPRGAFFVGTMKAVFRRMAIDWSRS